MTGRESNGPGPNHDRLDELFRHSPARQQPPAADTAAIREAVREEWKAIVRPNRFTPRRVAWTAAASLALAMFAWTQWGTGGRKLEATPLAQVERLIGTARVSVGETTIDSAVAAGSTLHSGQAVATRPGSGIALRWHDGTQLRLGSDTHMELVGAAALRLVQGSVYVDTRRAVADTSVEILVPQGRVRHLGTRYQVRAGLGATEFLVREGRIEFAHPAGKRGALAIATAGQRLSVNAKGEVALSEVPVWGEAWEWAEAVAPVFDAEGKPVAELLDWAARETGRTLVYESGEVRRLADEILIHGAPGLGPAEALAVTAATTDFTTRLDGGRIEVSIRK